MPDEHHPRGAPGTARALAERLQRAIDFGAIVLGTLGVIGFSAIVIYVVFARYILAATPHWAEELPRLLLVWVTFLGTISAFVRHSHFQAGLLPLIVGEDKAFRSLGVVAAGCSIVFLLVLATTGYDLAVRTWGSRTTALGWPVGLTYLALPVCCSVAAVAVALGLVLGERHDSQEMVE